MDERTSRTHAAAAEAPATPIDTERLRALLAASTPGPWDAEYVRSAVRHIARNCDIEGSDPEFAWDRYDDAPLIVAAVEALPALLDEVERLQGRRLPDRMHLDAVIAERDALAVQFYEARAALVDAAAWVVEGVGVPFDMTTDTPPPPVLRQAIYRHCFEDPNGTVHGGDLTYDDLVAFVDEEARWAPLVAEGVGE